MKNFIKAALVVSAFFASVSSVQAQAVKVDDQGRMVVNTTGAALTTGDLNRFTVNGNAQVNGQTLIGGHLGIGNDASISALGFGVLSGLNVGPAATPNASITNAGLGTFSGLQVNGATLHKGLVTHDNGINVETPRSITMGFDFNGNNPFIMSPINTGPTTLQLYGMGQNEADTTATMHLNLYDGNLQVRSKTVLFNRINAAGKLLGVDAVFTDATIEGNLRVLGSATGGTGGLWGKANTGESLPETLPTAAAQADYLNQKGNLPGLPTKKEIEEKGLDVGGNQMAIMKKLEELTVYMAALQKENDELKKKVEALGAKSKQ